MSCGGAAFRGAAGGVKRSRQSWPSKEATNHIDIYASCYIALQYYNTETTSLVFMGILPPRDITPFSLILLLFFLLAEKFISRRILTI